jgi:hypothetical protein
MGDGSLRWRTAVGRTLGVVQLIDLVPRVDMDVYLVQRHLFRELVKMSVHIRLPRVLKSQTADRLNCVFYKAKVENALVPPRCQDRIVNRDLRYSTTSTT